LRVVWRQSREQFSHPVDLDLLVDFHADGLIDRAEELADRGKRSNAAAQLKAAERLLRGSQYRDLREALDDLADSLKRRRGGDDDDD
jgi:hypothetical protein